MASVDRPDPGEEIPVSELKARCSEIIEKVASGGPDIIVTRRGVRVARIVCEDRQRRSPRGAWKGLIEVDGDIVHTDWTDEFEAARE